MVNPIEANLQGVAIFRFRSVYDLLEQVELYDHHPSCDRVTCTGSLSDFREGKEWYGPGDFDPRDKSSIISFARKGIVKGSIDIQNHLEAEWKFRKLEAGQLEVSGESWNLDSIINGEPECWNSLIEKRGLKNPCITLLYDVSANAGTGSNELLNRGLALVSMISALESYGFTVSLQLFNSCIVSPFYGNEKYIISIDSYESGKEQDVNLFSFSLIHTLFLRGVIFNYLFSVKGLCQVYPNLGYPSELTSENLKEVCPSFNQDSCFIIKNDNNSYNKKSWDCLTRSTKEESIKVAIEYAEKILKLNNS